MIAPHARPHVDRLAKGMVKNSYGGSLTLPAAPKAPDVVNPFGAAPAAPSAPKPVATAPAAAAPATPLDATPTYDPRDVTYWANVLAGNQKRDTGIAQAGAADQSAQLTYDAGHAANEGVTSTNLKGAGIAAESRGLYNSNILDIANQPIIQQHDVTQTGLANALTGARTNDQLTVNDLIGQYGNPTKAGDYGTFGAQELAAALGRVPAAIANDAPSLTAAPATAAQAVAPTGIGRPVSGVGRPAARPGAAAAPYAPASAPRVTAVAKQPTTTQASRPHVNRLVTKVAASKGKGK